MDRQTNLKGHKTSVQVTRNNYNHLLTTVEDMKNNYNVLITQTDLINMAISELYKDIDRGNKELLETLTSYNLI